jgi:hypothetical protein
MQKRGIPEYMHTSLSPCTEGSNISRKTERVARHVVPVSKNVQKLTDTINTRALLCTTLCRWEMYPAATGGPQVLATENFLHFT